MCEILLDMPAKAAAKASKSTKSTMSVEHKQALAVGREESRSVRRYLEAIEAHKPKRGRKRTREGIDSRLRQIEERLPTSDPLSRVHLVQERINLENELAHKEEAVDLATLEKDFVSAAKGYGERKGITYAAWRAAGVDANVLRKAGVPRTRG
jgi:hypothetical protein